DVGAGRERSRPADGEPVHGGVSAGRAVEVEVDAGGHEIDAGVVPARVVEKVMASGRDGRAGGEDPVDLGEVLEALEPPVGGADVGQPDRVVEVEDRGHAPRED